MDRDTLECLIHAFITTKLDYCNALLCGLPAVLIDRLQRVQNIAARILTRSAKHDHITPILSSLHWLPIQQRVKYKILVLVFKAMNNMAPIYLQELLSHRVSVRGLRSNDQNFLYVPFTKSSLMQNRAFSFAAPGLWNRLPNTLRICSSLLEFKSKLKTHLFAEFYYTSH